MPTGEGGGATEEGLALEAGASGVRHVPDSDPDAQSGPQDPEGVRLLLWDTAATATGGHFGEKHGLSCLVPQQLGGLGR